MSFKKAALNTTTEARTLNGMKAIKSTLNSNVDLFYKIGASRGKNLSAEFERAYQEDANLAIRVALWSRDVRGGAGERQIFRDFLVHLENHNVGVLLNTNLLKKVSELGRWDDLLVFTKPEVKEKAFALIKNAIDDTVKSQAILARLETMSEQEAQDFLDTYQNAKDA